MIPFIWGFIFINSLFENIKRLHIFVINSLQKCLFGNYLTYFTRGDKKKYVDFPHNFLTVSNNWLKFRLMI